MSIQDPISDMLTRIRNACTAGLRDVSIPNSKMKTAIADVLVKEGFIDSFIPAESVCDDITLKLKYHNRESVIEGLLRVSKPSCRVYCGYEDIPRVRNGLGIVILSTPCGIMSDRTAREKHVGGEILCYIW